MAISINANNAAFDSARNLQLTSQDFVTAVQRLSSGLRINTAADDPAGNSVSQRLTASINGADQAQRNVQDAVSMVQQANAGLNETMTLLQRMSTLAVQASNSTLTSADRLNIQQEVVGLVQEVNRVAQQTEFNTMSLLNGSAGGATVIGGGPDITNIQVQAGVTPDTTNVTIDGPTSTNGVASSLVAQVAGNSTFGGAAANGGVAPTLTITGPTNASATFTSYAGEQVSSFIQQVNNSGIGVTASINGSGELVLTSNNVGLNNVSNPTGPQDITVSGPLNEVDFGSDGGLGANLNIAGLTTASAGSNTGSNTVLSVSINGGASTTPTLQGINSDRFVGSGSSGGVTFRVTDPATIKTLANTDTFTVSQHSALSFQVGGNANATISSAIDAQTSTSLGIDGLDMTTQLGAETAISTVQSAIDQVSAAQANLGSIQNRLSDAGNLASATQSGLLSARSNILDANIPQEAIRFTRDQILMQAGTAVLAQANQSPAGLLGLFSSGSGH